MKVTLTEWLWMRAREEAAAAAACYDCENEYMGSRHGAMCQAFYEAWYVVKDHEGSEIMIEVKGE